MIEVNEAEGSLFDIFQWSFLQNMSILNDNTTTLQDVEQMVKLFQDTVETELKYITDPKKQMDILDAHIDKQAKWLATREYLIMFLDGKAGDFQKDIEEKSKVLDMMGTPLPQPLLNSLDFLPKEKEIKVRLEYNEAEQQALLSVSSSGEVNNKNNFDLETIFTNLSLSLKELDIDLEKELPNYLGNSESSLFSALTSNQEKNALQIVLRPLLIVQVKRMFWAYLNQRRFEIMENFLKKEELPLAENPEWYSLIEPIIRDNREIKINPKYLPYIAGKLKSYFSENDFLLLGLILEGKSITPKRIVFDGACSKICYFFREMKGKESVIKSTKLVIEKWLAGYIDFNNQQSKGITPITPDMAHQYVSSTTKLKGKDTIDISDFEEFEKKATKTK